MTDFSKKLDDATERIRQNVQSEQHALEAETQQQLARERAREETIGKSHGVAVQFTETCIKPIMDQIRTKLTGGLGREYSDKEHGFAGWSVQFGDTESLALKIHFGERGLWLSAEAQCVGSGVVYSENSKVYDAAEFDRTEAENWIESHALEAYEAFGQHADAVRNRPPMVTYNGVELE